MSMPSLCWEGVAMATAADYVRLPGARRRYINTTTGETISRRQYDRLFRLGPRGFTSYEKLAASRAKSGALPSRAPRGASGQLWHGWPVVSRPHVQREPSTSRPRPFAGTRRIPSATTAAPVVASCMPPVGSRSSIANGNLHKNVPFAYQMLRTMSAYAHAVKDAKAGRVAALESFADVTVRDVLGNEYTLLADINGIEQREQVYSIDATDFFTSEDFLVELPVLAGAA